MGTSGTENCEGCLQTRFKPGLHIICKAWLLYSRYRSLSVADGLLQSLEYLGRWELLPVVGSLSGSLTVFHGR